MDKTLAEGFKQWLVTLGYSKSTVKTSVHYLKAFFLYLENQKTNRIEDITTGQIKDYNTHLRTRSRIGMDGGLSANTISGHIGALKRFGRYLQLSGKGSLEISIHAPRESFPVRAVLTLQEIKKLYKACAHDMYGIRTRALLGVYYGCGLRKSEGRDLDLADTDLRNLQVHVRKGKNYRGRHVPMTAKIRDDLEYYIQTSRKAMAEGSKTKSEALFLNIKGGRLSGGRARDIIRQLADTAGIEKKIGLHSLRHSIATHLLQSGMELEDIGFFLGHSNPDSTQIYTHIANEI